MITNLDCAIKWINEGRKMHIAGSEFMLSKLPKGNWVGGTTTCFMTKSGGLQSDDQLFVELYDEATDIKVKTYDTNDIHDIAEDAYDNGFAVVIMPYGSEILEMYAKDAPSIPGLFMKSILGWVSSALADSAKVFNGRTGEQSDQKAVAIHIKMPEHLLVSVGIVNIFEPYISGPSIVFPKDDFFQDTCLVDGRVVKLKEYLLENKIDSKLPLISVYGGSNINVSIKSIDEDRVVFYAPVFSGRVYRLAKSIDNYVEAFEEKARSLENQRMIFSCNCILNYEYGALEGKATPPFYGPVTFGEIAYQLVNQTLVYLNVTEI